ncbi:MAG: methylmalonyl Co-A mutase-associated GTPase MeaB [Spirochaetota bacterium]|nr:MAG: methylmalonyl Co-A mutase-associated GTPase MeaB [Spirochaetota bacterium]
MKMNLDDPQYYVQGVLAKDRRILSKTITLIESSQPSHIELALDIVDRLLPYSGNAVRLGITGIPGVGKSTFIQSLGLYLIKKEHSVAVLAVDPSSARSGGSIMADKTRMEKLSSLKKAFIRPSPSGGTLGGVTRKTRETMIICEAAGFDVIIIETVGVGQSEISVAYIVDFFLLLMLAGIGDEMQGIKRGIIELADAIAINKADGENVQKSEKAQVVYERLLNLLSPSYAHWIPPVHVCSALEMKNIDKVWETVLQHRAKLNSSGELEEKRKKQALAWMWSLLEEGLKERFNRNTNVQGIIPEIADQVTAGTITPTAAAYKLLRLLDK